MLNKNPRRKPLNSPPTCAALFTYALPNPAYRDRTTANTALFREIPAAAHFLTITRKSNAPVSPKTAPLAPIDS